MSKRVKVTRESNSGRNTQFRDTRNGSTMSRSDFVRAIRNGRYGGYHVRMVNGVATPVSNPDRSNRNNLG